MINYIVGAAGPYNKTYIIWAPGPYNGANIVLKIISLCGAAGPT